VNFHLTICAIQLSGSGTTTQRYVIILKFLLLEQNLIDVISLKKTIEYIKALKMFHQVFLLLVLVALVAGGKVEKTSNKGI